MHLILFFLALALFGCLNAEIKVAVIGDSISLFLPWKDVEEIYRQEGKEVKFIDRSLPGMRSAQGFHQLRHVLKDHEIDVLIYTVGFCSARIASPLDHVKEMMELTFKEAQSKNIKILVGIVDLKAYPSDIINPGIYNDYFDELYKNMSNEYGAVLFPFMTQEIIQTPDYIPDGIHPGPEGYKVIISTLKPYLDQLISN
jgi:lysophospholipase L1-like esterase